MNRRERRASHGSKVRVPQASHGIWTIEDRKWFENNPGENYMVRDPFPSEVTAIKTDSEKNIIGVLEKRMTEQTKLNVLVVQIRTGLRTRIPCLLLPTGSILVTLQPNYTEVREVAPSVLAGEILRSVPPDTTPEPNEAHKSRSNCAVCRHEFLHGDITVDAIVSNETSSVSVCFECAPLLPKTAELIALGIELQKPPNQCEAELKKLKSLTDLFNKKVRESFGS